MEVAQLDKISLFTKNLEPGESALQKQAFEKLLGLDFPTSRDEYWKYTRLAKLAKNSFVKQLDADKLNLTKHIISNDYLVVVNGYVREDLSQYSKLDFSVEMLSAERISEDKRFNANVAQDNLFNQMNAAFFDKTICIEIGEKKINEGPLQIIFVSKGINCIANNRLFISAGAFSQSEIIETFVSIEAENCFTNQVTEVFIEENAHLRINKLQIESNSSTHISTEQIYQAKNSNFMINTITLSGMLVRNNINIEVAGENCETHMNAAIIANDQHVDNHTFVNHLVPNCFSNENYKYVLDGKATGVFNGRVVVQKDAQKINAYQKNGNILLSDFANINSKPELEIYADDVKCSHGSTTGQLDEDAIFYLQSRGISKDKARKMMISAFVGEIFEETKNEQFNALAYEHLVSLHNWNIDK